MLVALLPLLLSQPALARKTKEPPPPATAPEAPEAGASTTPTVPRFSRPDVKGWVDANRLALLFVHGKGDYPILNAQQMFLDGFRFP